MSYVLAAYGLAVLVIGGYALSIRRRRREAQRALEAWGAEADSAEVDGAGVGSAGVDSAGVDSAGVDSAGDAA
ncbi:MAG: heme exporter protein CcmD [Anaerolineae bacterium]